MSFHFSEKSWVEIEKAIKDNTVIILPVGQTEEHGRHLPVGTDAMIARRFGDDLGKELQGRVPVLVMEPVTYGYSQKGILEWPGCPNISSRTIVDYLFDIIDSLASMGFKKIVTLDCHGNHDCMLRLVMREIVDKHDVYTLTLNPGKMAAKLYDKIKDDPEGDIHGGEFETSLILAIRPDLVHIDEYTDVDAIRCNSILRGPVSTWGLQKSKTGLYGNPLTATAEKGVALFAEAAKQGALYIEEYYNYVFE